MTLAEERLDFKVAVLAVDGGCLIHDDPSECRGDIQAHHVVTQQQLTRAGREDVLWDPNNGMAVCDSAHDRHHLGYRRIEYDRIPDRCIEFARANGFERILARYYTTKKP